jgi:flagellar hook-basal body complex protein FliE
MAVTGISGSGFAQAMQGVGSVHAPRAPLASPSIAPAGGAATEGPSFGDRLSGALNDLGQSQSRAEQSASAYEYGAESNLASVMVDQQVAQLGLQLAVNVRNKALGAYKDIMNMPV